MSTFTWTVDYGANNEVKPNVLKAVFGEGYEQRTSNGINTMPRSWTLGFTKSPSDIDAIEAFLETAAGVTSFDWTPPRGSSGKWLCEEWKRGIPNAAFDTLDAKFREVFGE